MINSRVTIVPWILMMIGMVIMVIGSLSVVVPLSMLRLGVGPFSVTVGGIPALSALLIAVGAFIFISGLWSLVMMVRH